MHGQYGVRCPRDPGHRLLCAWDLGVGRPRGGAWRALPFPAPWPRRGQDAQLPPAPRPGWRHGLWGTIPTGDFPPASASSGSRASPGAAPTTPLLLCCPDDEEARRPWVRRGGGARLRVSGTRGQLGTCRPPKPSCSQLPSAPGLFSEGSQPRDQIDRKKEKKIRENIVSCPTSAGSAVSAKYLPFCAFSRHKGARSSPRLSS